MVATVPTSPQATGSLSIPQQLEHADPERLRQYREHLEFYQGSQWFEPRRRRDRRLTFNYAKTVIEKTASYTMSGVSFAVDPEDGTAESLEHARRAEAALAEVYEANNLEQLDFDNEIDCSVLGDAAYKVIWDAAEERVRVTGPDVQGLFVSWAGDDPSHVWRVASRYTLTREEAEALYGPLPTLKSSYLVVEVWTDESFELWLDETLLEERPNPYGFIPFVVYPNVR